MKIIYKFFALTLIVTSLLACSSELPDTLNPNSRTIQKVITYSSYAILLNGEIKVFNKDDDNLRTVTAQNPNAEIHIYECKLNISIPESDTALLRKKPKLLIEEHSNVLSGHLIMTLDGESIVNTDFSNGIPIKSHNTTTLVHESLLQASDPRPDANIPHPHSDWNQCTPKGIAHCAQDRIRSMSFSQKLICSFTGGGCVWDEVASCSYDNCIGWEP